MICFSILVATVDVIGNRERLQIGRLFIIDLSKHTLSPIDKCQLAIDSINNSFPHEMKMHK
jgi:hypothetical protein